MGRIRESDPKTGKPVVSSAGKFWGMSTIYGRDGDHGTPYMTRVWLWGLRLHIFHRPDLDPDCHDHPWDFWTLPIWPPHGYVEEVVQRVEVPMGSDLLYRRFQTCLQIVPAFRVSFRPATHCHRVLGAYTGKAVHPYWGDEAPMKTEEFTTYGWTPQISQRKIVTLVWRTEIKRSWGFLKNRDGRWCWVAWRDYVFNGGKEGPCQ